MDIIHDSKANSVISPVFSFSFTLFSSACLMFVLQPMFGKALLPLLGGSASVWNTCMVFYQTLLFLGYSYAHLLTSYFKPRRQIIIHGTLLALSLSFLPISLIYNSAPPISDNPSIWLLNTLLLSIGLPFFILSTTSPLLQKWFSALGHSSSNDPYYLSIASNTGSLLALLSYPFFLEPEWGLSQQQHYWSVGFLLLASLISICMLHLRHCRKDKVNEVRTSESTKKHPNINRKVQWLLLSFIPSSLLLGTTNYISIDIATVPLLWVIPLALYLLSFILVFSKFNNAIQKKTFLIQPVIVIPFLVYYFSQYKLNSFSLELIIHLIVFFISIMVCHGELAKKRPGPEHLTQYYLIMSFGGMLGGIFNSFVAPLIFNSIYEYPLMLVFALMLNPTHQRIRLYLKTNLAKTLLLAYLLTFFVVFYFNYDQFNDVIVLCLTLIVVGIASYFLTKKNPLYIPLFGLLIVSCALPEKQQGDEILYQSRNFYGILTVKKNTNVAISNRKETLHELYSGTTKHGTQLTSDFNLHCKPNGYYAQQGPLGEIFQHFDSVNQNWDIGVVGLGAGEMMGYAKKSQNWDYFELDPAVIDIASNSNYFTFLKKCTDHYLVHLGDARVSLEKQVKKYDMLVIDAFTSDSIPTHLLTKEAIELYLSRLNPNGILVMHISNRYLDLKPVLADHANKLKLAALIKEYRPRKNIPLVFRSDWAVFSKKPEDLKPLLELVSQFQWQKLELKQDIRSWTDDYTSIMAVWK